MVHSENEDWYNLAKRTFECTKTMMSLHWYTLFKIYGQDIFSEYVTHQFNLGKSFAKLIEADPQLELAVSPMSNIVCFRYFDNALTDTILNELNLKIRQSILEEGEYYIVQTQLTGLNYLRTTIMNPFTTEADLNELLRKVKHLAQVHLDNK